MKSKYEISIWSDIYDEEKQRFTEQKEIVIGSDTMTSESRARNPKLVSNVNGTNKFTFDMYYRYIDTRTGEEVKNPYIKYLINERKIKVFWKNEWYDLLVKQVKEDQAGRVFSYTCEDTYITELSKTGFNLVFDTELQNNIGTASELIQSVIDDTDWRIDPNSQPIYQITEQPVYEVTILHSFEAEKCPNGEQVTIQENLPALVYYSFAPDINNLQNDIQIYYSGTSIWEQDQNEMLVVNGDCYNVSVTWDIDDQIATAKKDTIIIFQINFAEGLSKKYRAERYVQSQKSVYNDTLGRYVNVYTIPDDESEDGVKTIYGFQTTEYNDALAVVNLITNPSNFKNTSGWEGDELYWKISPEFNGSTVVSEYSALSYLRFQEDKIYYNRGIQNNRSYISNGFIEGEKYIFRIRAKVDGEDLSQTGYITNPQLLTPFISSRNIDFEPTYNYYFETNEAFWDGTNKWLEYDMTCIKSCSYDMLISTSYPFGIFIDSDTLCWVEEIQFYREVWGNTGYETEEQIRIDPGQMNIQSVAQVVWKYFDPAAQIPDVTKNTLEYLFSSLNEWYLATPVQNHYERYGTIEESQSNRFNILQSIAETFQCWIRFKILHDDQGYIQYDDDNLPCKYIQVVKEIGTETGIGFIYGVDLKGVTRSIKSNDISTKIIVSQNENQFGLNGFCSIARSKENYPLENVIYNFDYYIQQGLLDGNALNNDLYSVNGINYYSQLHSLNLRYSKNLDGKINKENELTKQKAMQTVYDQYLTAARDEKTSIEESIMKLAGADSFADAQTYVQTHVNDTKVQTLMNDRNYVISQINVYTQLFTSISQSVSLLEEYVANVDADQEQIIADLRALNKQFYTKYARFIQEGTWSSEDYWDDDLYYLDALQVAYTSSRPQISYDINVMRLSELNDYSSKVFNLGDISFIQDIKYFGYMSDGITPYKEKVILTEITSCFETPDKDTIKVQNYKTQFDDLFQRITAATQQLELSEGKYAKAANIVQSDGTIKSSVIQNTFNSNKDLVYGAQNESVTMDNTGVTVTDNSDATHLLKITSGGVFVSADGGASWKNAIRGDGINTELLTAGKINTEAITVYSGEFPSFRWDSSGLNAYKFGDAGVDTRQFVRFDQYGVYGMQNTDPIYVPSDEGDIYENARFGLTWSKFFMKSTGDNKYIEISTDRDIVVAEKNSQNVFVDRIVIGRVDGSLTDSYGMRIRNADNEVIFECGNLYDDVTQTYTEKATIAGWKFDAECLESEAVGQNQQTIKIYANGNIGCYGNDPTTYPENVYVIQNSSDISAISLNDTEDRNIPAGSTIYVFVSSVGKTKTQKQLAGAYDSDQMTYNNAVKPTPPSIIQIAWERSGTFYNYNINDIVWTMSLNNNGCSHTTYTEGSGTEQTQYTTYIYAFDLVAKVNETTIFNIPYTTTFGMPKNKYVPASNTKWSIDNNGDAIFHDIYADGGSIAGWWIDSTSIYQTKDGSRDRIKNGQSNIKTELNSTGTATSGNFDYTIITDAVNAAMATIGGVLMEGGLINGYNIAQIANIAWAAYNGLDDKVDKTTYNTHNHKIDSPTTGAVTVYGKDSIGGNITAETGDVVTDIPSKTNGLSS